jgi:hypothetical protein
MEGFAMTSGTVIDGASVVNFGGLLNELQIETGRSADQALQYASGKFLASCSASAKPGSKLRKVIANPLFKAADSGADARKAALSAKSDMRRARFGVMKYSQKAPPKFTPIYRTGEYGRVRFLDKKSGQIRWRSKKGTLQKEVNFDQGIEGNASIKNDKRRVIKRAGLARKVFRIMRAQVLAGGLNVENGSSWTGERFAVKAGTMRSGYKLTKYVTLHSMLTYLTNAYPTIAQNSMAAAKAGLQYELKNQIAKRTAQAMRRRKAAA